MIELDGFGGFVQLYLLAFFFGAFGGLVGELLKGNKGRFKTPRWTLSKKKTEEVDETSLSDRQKKKAKKKAEKRRRLFRDLGGWASVLVGAAAAMAVWWILPPKETLVPNQATAYSYSAIAVVSLSIIVGSAGSAFLAAFQAKALAAVQVQEIKAQAARGVDEVAAVADGTDAKAKAEQKAIEVKKRLQDIGDSGIGNPDEDQF